jgi:hypothetical protein
MATRKKSVEETVTKKVPSAKASKSRPRAEARDEASTPMARVRTGNGRRAERKTIAEEMEELIDTPPVRPGKGKPAAGPAEPAAEVRFAMIQEAAYFLAERRGFAGGDTQADWLEAEKLVDAQIKASLQARRARS